MKIAYDFYETNAYSATALRTLGKKKYHVIIDDGSHHQRMTSLFVADHYYHLLEPGGVMILEDIPDEALLKELTDLFNKKSRKEFVSLMCVNLVALTTSSGLLSKSRYVEPTFLTVYKVCFREERVEEEY